MGISLGIIYQSTVHQYIMWNMALYLSVRPSIQLGYGCMSLDIPGDVSHQPKQNTREFKCFFGWWPSN